MSKDRVLAALLDSAREIRRVHAAQAAYIKELQGLAAEARRTGKSQSHRIAPRVHDYGDGVERLLLALAAYESAPGEGAPGAVEGMEPKSESATPKSGTEPSR